MNRLNRIILILVAMAWSSAPFSQQHSDSAHDEHDDEKMEEQHQGHGAHIDDDESDEHEEGHEEKAIVELSDASIEAAAIHIGSLSFQPLTRYISAPGEVQLDQYSSAEVTPLIGAVVVKRHAKMGDEVVVGQPLVTLASVEVAAAKGELLIAGAEWQRTSELGRATLGEKRYVEAGVAYQQARLTLRAYGLDDKQIDAVSNRDQTVTIGQFDLNAPLPGTVLSDDFRIGQRIDAGQRLFLIADEKRVWVEAYLSPIQAQNIQVNVPAQVNMGGHWHTGMVVQKHHLLDERTRTVALRIAIELTEEHHHAGEFVQVSIGLSNTLPNALSSAPATDSHSGSHGQPDSDQLAMIVSESALIQDADGNWTVFVELQKDGAENRFEQTIVHRGTARAGQVPIYGLDEGISVVTEGAFFLSAELAKGGFDIHNH